MLPLPDSPAPKFEERDYIVAYLDVLGTRFKNRNEDAVLRAKRLTELKDFVSSTAEFSPGGGLFAIIPVIVEIATAMSGAPAWSQRRANQFSDSILISVPAEGDLTRVLGLTTSVLMQIFHFGLSHGLPLRGAVSYGPAVFAEGVAVGDSVYEAVEWEQLAEWSGVLFAPSAGLLVDAAWKAGKPIDSIPYSAPLKTGYQALSTNCPVLSWPMAGPANLVPILKSRLLGAPMPLDAAVRLSNTIQFAEYVRNRSDLTSSYPQTTGMSSIVETIWEKSM